MKIKEQTRKLIGCSKQCYELVIELTKSMYIYGKATLTCLEENFKNVQY